MRKTANAGLCALSAVLLAGCASSPPQFVKLDNAGNVDSGASGELLQRDLAECEVVQAHVRGEEGLVYNHAAAKQALDNCMRSKGYVRS